jgi:serine/threonine-protein phosphatase 2A regulatory subunit A
MRLLCDNEAELRMTAAEKVTKFYCISSPELAIQYILACVCEGAYPFQTLKFLQLTVLF